jgi:hypothetical protein
MGNFVIFGIALRLIARVFYSSPEENSTEAAAPSCPI